MKRMESISALAIKDNNAMRYLTKLRKTLFVITNIFALSLLYSCSSDCFGDSYDIDENGLFCPSKNTPITQEQFNTHVVGHAWVATAHRYIGDNGKVDEEIIVDPIPFYTNYVFRSNSVVTTYYCSPKLINKTFSFPISYDSESGRLYLTPTNYYYILSLEEDNEGKRHLWMLQGSAICHFEETTEEHIMTLFPDATPIN